MATAPTAPPADGPALPPAPSQDDPDNFDAEADASFLAHIPFQAEMQALKANVYGNAQGTYNNALEAATSAVAASSSEVNVAALSNFKGNWSALTGALNKPASVFHNGAYWALLNNLANVTTSTPGVSADWQVCGGAWPIVPISTNTTAAPWKTYLITAACTLTLPAISGNGKQVGVIVLAGVAAAIVAPAGVDKIRNVAGNMSVDGVPFDKILTDTGATYGWA